MADDVWRLDYQMAPDCRPRPRQPARGGRANGCATQLGADVEFEFVWIGPYQYRDHLLERFRHGRLLFIGDAAHAMSPFGARGGNTGIQDAANLGWKLALVLQGRAGEALLDSYDTERHRAADENLRITRARAASCSRARTEYTLRRAVLQLARTHAFARTLLNTGRLCAPHHYAGLSTVGTGPNDGKAVPNVALGDRQLVELLRGNELAAFVFEQSARRCHRSGRGASRLPVRVLLRGRDFDDPHGLLAAQTGTPPGGVALIRPDAHLSASLPSAEPAALLAAARRALAA